MRAPIVSFVAAVVYLAFFGSGGAFALDERLLVNRNSGMCAELKDANLQVGARVSQGRCFDQPHQRWLFQKTAAVSQIVNVRSGMCLAARPSDGAAIVQTPCNGEASQNWSFRRVQDWFQIVSAVSGECLDVADSSIDDDAASLHAACGEANSQKWTLSDPALKSAWSPKISLPLIPVAASTLRNGKILMWASHDPFTFGDDQGKTFTTIFDPASGSSTSVTVSSTGHDMFCPGTATLPDGRILVNGGSSNAKTSIYDPELNVWTTSAEMNVPRGYQGDAVLPSGDVLTVGGSWSGGIGYKKSEVWNRLSGWRVLSGVNGENLAGPDPAGQFRSDNHMWLFAYSDRYVLHAGPSAQMHWIDVKGDGRILPAGDRGDDAYAMNGNVVMIGPTKLLKIGGAPAYESLQASDGAHVIDLGDGPQGPVHVTRQRPMAFARAFANSVALPSGDVVVVGGSNFPEAFSDERSVMIPELWSKSGGKGDFRRLAPMTVPRNYHSIALLMKDARVFVGGGGLCSSPCDTNHPDAEILTPPYLLNDDGSLAARPVITSAPAVARLGERISVSTDVPVSQFSLIRLAAVTHSVSNDQRSVQLKPAVFNGTTYALDLKTRGARLLPGDWMLFAIEPNGVPSVAAVVRISAAS